MESSSSPAAPAAAVSDSGPWLQRWQRFAALTLRGFHAYATWLVSISWRRFIVLALLLLAIVGIVHDKPPFTWTVTESVEERAPRAAIVITPDAPREAKEAAGTEPPPASGEGGATGPSVRIDRPGRGGDAGGVEISIDKQGIRIVPRRERAAAPATSGSAADAAASAASATGAAAARGVHIALPPGVTAEVREALENARRELEDALREARDDAAQAAREAVEARQDAERAIAKAARDVPRRTVRRTSYGIGDMLMQFTLLWILGSAIVKATYKGRIQAERVAARATETAEAESLKRQVVEARMAAMQAQVEPHFLFNTLASIDHLIETDPARASQMQKNLIALLRASMPTMRETAGGTGGNGVRDLGRELAVIRPYLEILKVRMEERLTTQIDVPEGLLSAEFPPMMIQTLVENAIKHGLEPKAEGGHLALRAEIVHGKLQVSVADTGLGFGRAATAGTGVGLANVRERLQLLYGAKASLTVAENPGGGTLVTITVPYRTVQETEA